jgi:hypothetical protein
LWKKSNLNVSIKDISPFILKPNNSDGIDGGMFVLEDMKGDCARDKLGRPIVYIQGMLHGTMDEMQKQMVYCMERASLYHKTGYIKCNTVILDAIPKKGNNNTFRFPDMESKQLMKMQKLHFPGSLSSTTHICGIPQYIVWAFALCKPFMDAESYNNMLIKPDTSHLSQYIDKENLLKEFGGELEFDVKKYIDWRASEEGVEIDYNNIKRYDATNVSKISETDMTSQLMQTTSLQLSEDEIKPLKFNILSKQGSGVGLFANYKWKDKLVAVGPGGICYYFDSLEISNTNKVSTIISLLGAYIELIDKDDDNNNNELFKFQLVTAERNYTFGTKNEEERNDWVTVFNDQINISSLTNNYQKQMNK